MSGVLVLGSSNVDLTIRGPRLPLPGETVLGGEFYQAWGGKGANQAVAAARASGRPVTFVAAVGDDGFGEEMLRNFRLEGLRCDWVRQVVDCPSGVALILVGGGENLISVASGANAQLTAADVDRVPDEAFRAARVFLANWEAPPDAVARGLQRARQAGAMTVLNPAPARVDVTSEQSLQWVDVLTPNRVELAQLAGAAVSNLDELRKAGGRLAARGCCRLVVTIGADGVWLYDASGVGPPVVEHVPGIAAQVVDTTGAGDAFNGALAVALAEGRTLREAAIWGNIAGSLAVSRQGAQPSLPSRQELEGVAAALAAGLR